jgi:hypothetical protein
MEYRFYGVCTARRLVEARINGQLMTLCPRFRMQLT